MSWRGPTEGAGVEPTVTKELGLELVIVSPDGEGRSIPVLPGHFTLGADRRCDVVLAQPGVLASHAQGNHGEDGSLWVNAVQPNSTFINGAPITKWAQLTPGSFLRLGPVEMVLRERGKGSSPSGTLHAPTPMRSPPVNVARSGVNRAPGASGLNRSPGLAPAQAPDEIPGTHVRPSGSHSHRGGPSGVSGQPLQLSQGAELHLQTGDVIADRYRIITKLAAGGMGEVYKAEHIELSRVFALKVMRPELSNDPEFVERFKREAVASGRIGHQNIVDITDFGRTADGRFYFVMEFLDGRTLASIVGHEGAQPYERVLYLAVQMCRALGAAHKLGITHRDLKPENVMVLQRDSQADLVKVVDFGVAKVSTGNGAGGQTAIGMVVGTPQYMAPEQAAGLGVDARSDIYSLGLIFYELLTGRPCFKGETPSILMGMQMMAKPPPLAPGPLALPVPSPLEQVIFKMLEKKAADRPQATDEVLKVLELLLRELNLSPSGRSLSGVITQPNPPGAWPSGVQRAVSGRQPAVNPSGSQRAASGRQPAAGTEPSWPSSADAQLPPAFDQQAPLQPPAKSKLPLVVGGALLLLVVAGGAAFALKGSSAPPTDTMVVPPPPVKVDPPTPAEKKVDEPARAAMVKTVLVTLPEKAAVYEGTVYVGTTPLTMTREAGATAELKFQARGFKDEVRQVRFSADTATVEIELQREKAAPVGKGGKKKKSDLQDDPYSQPDDLKELPDP